jgi:O-antigen ligase
MLRFLLLFQILYTVYQGHYNFESGVPGLNLPNALFLLVLVMLRFSGRPDEVEPKAFMRGPLLFFMAMLVLAFVIAQVRAPGAFMVDVTYLKNALFSPLLYFMYLHCRQDLRNTRLLVIAVMAVAAIAAVQAVRQGFDYGIGTYVETHRASGPFGSNYRDANRAGVYYAMFLPMFIGLALFLRDKRWRIAALGGVVLLTMALLFTYSRQAYFIAVLGLAVLLLRRSVLLAIVLGATLASLVGFLPESVTQRVEETQQKGPHGEEKVDESTASRWEIWAGALAMWQANPAGVGQNRFKDEIGHYSAFQHFDAHNFYVLTLAEGGPQALLALLLLVLATFRLGAWLRRSMPPDDPEARALAIGFSVTALCMALGNLYGSPFLEGNVMGTFWILCGLLERYMLLKTRQVPASTALVVSGADRMIERFPLAARARGLPARRP